MPMNWNAEADAKLFAAVLKVHDIKINYAALATEMGAECTAKAITHRIAKIKNDAKASGSPSTGSITPTPQPPKSRGKAAAKGQAGKNKKRPAQPDDEADEDERKTIKKHKASDESADHNDEAETEHRRIKREMTCEASIYGV